MKTHKSMYVGMAGTLLVAGALACPYVFANPDVDMPTERTQGDVTFVTGGVGQNEVDAMEHAKSQYPLSLEFVQHAKPRDVYIANVQVKLTDTSGNVVLDTTTDGPYLLAKLPKGKYKITAVDETGRSMVKQVTVSSGKPEHLILVWS